MCTYCWILFKCTHRVNTWIQKQWVQPFHVGQALCLRTNVHSYAPQERQRDMRTANAICGRDAKCSLQLTQFHLICDSDLTQTHRNRIAQVLCNGPLVLQRWNSFGHHPARCCRESPEWRRRPARTFLSRDPLCRDAYCIRTGAFI